MVQDPYWTIWDHAGLNRHLGPQGSIRDHRTLLNHTIRELKKTLEIRSDADPNHPPQWIDTRVGVVVGCHSDN